MGRRTPAAASSCSPATCSTSSTARTSSTAPSDAFGGLDLLVLNAAHQRNRGGIDEVPTEDFDAVVRINLYATVFLARAAVPRMDAGSSIITTSSIQGFDPSYGSSTTP